MKTALRIGWILLCLILALTARCWNLRDVFLEGKIYFVDADCYSRMTRARMVAEHPGTVVRHHDFENWPQGVTPHTTAPLDYLIVGLKAVLDTAFAIFDSGSSSVLHGQTLDLAGALIGPILGVMGAAFLLVWALVLRLRYWGMALLLYAISPILVHGTLLGRPDHQAILIVLLLIALGAEIALTRGPTGLRIWSIINGAAWACSLWVSLYEPSILLGAVLILWLLLDRAALLAPERRVGWMTFAAILALAFLLEGWRIEVPDAAARAYFANWKASIGELAHLDLASPLLFAWLGWTALAVPVLVVFARKAERAALPVLALLAITLGLTVWQIRWGYFLAVVFIFALALSPPLPRRPWMAWAIFLIGLWPVAQSWDALLFPDDEAQRSNGLKRAEAASLRELVATKATSGGPFLAPWWLSPSISYWTAQPGVAGSSHESLPGIVDTARVYLATDAAEAWPILRARRVAWILADTPERIVPTSAALLGVPPPPQCLAQELARPSLGGSPDSPLILESVAPNSLGYNFFRIWRVRADAVNMPAP